MSTQQTKKNRVLNVRTLFEPNRLELESLANAYKQIVPITKRRAQTASGKNNTSLSQDKRMIGGVA